MCVLPVSADDVEPYTSNLIESYCATISASSGYLNISFSATANNTMDTLGVAAFYIQKKMAPRGALCIPTRLGTTRTAQQASIKAHPAFPVRATQPTVCMLSFMRKKVPIPKQSISHLLQ